MPNVSVLIPLALPGPYDYAVPPDMAVVPGAIVRVPLGKREIYGVVWGAAEGDAPRPSRFTMLVVRRDGKWMIAHHHSSPRAATRQ